MNTKQVDLLNIGLLGLSLLIAYLLPFRLFLYTYAVLGPLHYLTEINWLQSKNYFVKPKNWLWIPISFVLLVVIPKLFSLPGMTHVSENETLTLILNKWLLWSNGLIFLWLMVSAGLVLAKNKRTIWIYAFTGLVLAVLFRELNTYVLIVGLLLPTLLHVYVFTLLFMLYGTLKSASRYGYMAATLMVIVPFFIAYYEVDPGSYFFSDLIKETFLQSNFHLTNTKLAAFFGFSDGTSFFFYSSMELKMQIFIAFAYTYHYLNWFSKTTVIGWHKNLKTGRSLMILVIWAASVALYSYDYTIGLILVLSLSMLHVLLEFPLNILSIQGIGKHLFPLGRQAG